MKAMIFMGFLLLSSLGLARELREPEVYSRIVDGKLNKLNSDQRESSYKKLFSSGAYRGLGIFDRSCEDFLYQVYSSGKNFRSEVLAKILFPLSDEKFISGMHHRWFYHYTNSSSFISSMLAANQKDSKSVDQLFIYTRTHASGSLSWRTVLYVAEDPISSQGFGPRQLRVSFPMNTRVLRPSREIWQNAYSEMSQKYPGLEHACPFLSYGMADGFDGYGDPIAIYSGVFLPMAEDSGADIISYGAGSGKANQMLCKNASQNEVCGRWYQILNPTAIDAVSSP